MPLTKDENLAIATAIEYSDRFLAKDHSGSSEWYFARDARRIGIAAIRLDSELAQAQKRIAELEILVLDLATTRARHRECEMGSEERHLAWDEFADAMTRCERYADRIQIHPAKEPKHAE